MHSKAKPWREKKSPGRILAIRLHALGDVVITLPYLQGLRAMLPGNTRIDFLTLEECASIPRHLNLFDHVYVIRGGRNFKRQLAFAFLLLPKLFMNRYGIVLDLNDAIISRLVRKMLFPKAWSTFDKYAQVPAGIRTQLTMEAAGLGAVTASARFSLKNNLNTETMLKENGWKDNDQIIMLNPAGAFETRNWPLENYVGFARLWLQVFPHTQFLIMGVASIRQKAAYFKEELGEDLIDLVNKTTAAQAFAIMQQVKMVLTEDSGLMHMAWVSGIPTLALFGSTRGYQARPLGEKSVLLDSSDLACGNCMLATCRYGDTHCLTRYSP